MNPPATEEEAPEVRTLLLCVFCGFTLSCNCGHYIEPDDFPRPEGFCACVRVQKIYLNFDHCRPLSTICDVSVSAADVRVERRNLYDFKYIDSRMAILYHGEQLGVGELGCGTIRSRNTVELPSAITVEVVRLLLNAQQDITSNVATLNINSVLSGRFDLAHIFKKHVCALLNWAMNVFHSNQTLKRNDCKQTMKL